MEKAYDLKALGEKIRDHAATEGLPIAEEALEKLGMAVYDGMKDWFHESAVITETKLDDFIVPLWDLADQYVMPQIEKIDLDGDGD